MKYIITTCIGIAASFSLLAQTNYEAQAEALVKQMTLEEKANFIRGQGFKIPGAKEQGAANIGVTKEKVPGAAGVTYSIPRLGIPAVVLADGPAGVRIDSTRADNPGKTYYAAAFPVATLLASTWDTALVKKVGAAFGGEVRDYGVDVILAPAMNIQRNPLGGRNFEYYSEDPVVSGNIAAALVNGIQSNGVGVSVKHFAANNQEFNRTMIDETISRRALREIYLRGFEIAVKKAHPWTVMSSYNKINGIYTSENYALLTTILRKEWHFKGLVMTDWFGGSNAVAQMKAGNDLLMPGYSAQTDSVLAAVKNGTLSEKVLDENVVRILAVVLQSPSYKKLPHSDKPDLKKDAAVAREAAANGMVLLKNDNAALPFKHIRSAALFGNTSYDLLAGGTGSGAVNKPYMSSLIQGLKNIGCIADAQLETIYETYLQTEKAKQPKKNIFEEFIHPTPAIAEINISKSDIAQKAAGNDIAVLTIGRQSGEGNDRKVDTDFNLTETEKTLIKNVSDAFHAENKKLIVILNIANPIETASWADEADAILLAWQPGMEGGNAIADILGGKVNPSGRLAVTFPAKYTDVPNAKTFPGKEYTEQSQTSVFGMTLTPAEASYDEGVYVGYRYYSTFGVKPAYAFGYGLSYTDFSYSNIKLSSDHFSDKIKVSLTVANTGKVAGKTVVQLYLTAPNNILDKPAEELKAFAKTELLQPGGASQNISFELTPESLASFNTQRSAWIADAGEYSVRVGVSSEDIKQTAKFTLPKEIIVEKTDNILTPQKEIHEIQNINRQPAQIVVTQHNLRGIEPD